MPAGRASVLRGGIRRRRPTARCGGPDGAIRRSKEFSHMTAAEFPPPRRSSSTRRIPTTRIATITLNRPDQLNVPTIAHAAALRRPVVQGEHRRRREGPRDPRRRRRHLGSGADLAELMASGRRGTALHEEFGLDEDDDVTMPADRSYPCTGRRCCTGTPTRGPAAGASRTSRRSASSRSRATATAGTSTRRPTPTSSSRPTTRSSAIPPSATSATRRACGSGR